MYHRREINLECGGELCVLTMGRGEFLSDSPFLATEDTKRLLTFSVPNCSHSIVQYGRILCKDAILKTSHNSRQILKHIHDSC
jgi:hypothetical protein